MSIRYLCIGRGYYSIADVRDGETLLSDIDGARAAIYDPFTSPILVMIRLPKLEIQ